MIGEGRLVLPRLPKARSTFATEALAGGISIFELARCMGHQRGMIERTYGHLARDSERQFAPALTRGLG